MSLSRPCRILAALVLAVTTAGPAGAQMNDGDPHTDHRHRAADAEQLAERDDDGPHGHIGAPRQLTGTLSGKQFVAGPEIYVDAETDDDVFAAGGDIEFRGARVLDIFAAGGIVDVSDVTAQDAILAGATVSTRAILAGDFIAAGASVELGHTAEVAGDVLAAGSRIALAGDVDGDIRAAGGEIRIDGTVGGDVNLAGGRIVLGPNANIQGDLTYRSGDDLQRMDGAQVAGQIERRTFEEPEMPGVVEVVFAGALGWLGVVLSGIALAALLIGTIPRLVTGASDGIVVEPWPSLGIGLILLIGVPVAAPILMATVIGIPIGVLALLAYALLIAVGLIAAALAIGKHLPWVGGRHASLLRFGPRFWRAVAGVVLLALVALLPFLGGFVLLLAATFGLGATAVQTWQLVGGRS
jgi:cytoskeletal protein CcmA (bactofilin family)